MKEKNMHWIQSKPVTELSRQAPSGKRLSRSVLTTIAMAGLIFSAATARAACGNFSGLHAGTRVQMPMLEQAESNAENSPADSREPIVGLWYVVYTADGAVFNETLDQWHSDGTEFENAYLAPSQGNICFGVWKPVGPRTVRLHHVGWAFTPGSDGTASGTFTLDETNVVSSDGKTYTGTFTFKTFDLTGKQGADVTGTILATRITVD
jgi:hypothetical protein